MIGVLLSCIRTVGTIMYYSFLVACFGRMFRYMVGERALEAVVCSWSDAPGSELLSGGRFLSRMLPCQLKIWSIAICNKLFSFTAANSIPHSQVYKRCLKCVVYMHLFVSSGRAVNVLCALYSHFPVYISCTQSSDCYVSRPQ